MRSSDARPETKTILYDASCPVCRLVISKVDGSVSHDCFKLQDVNTGILPAGVRRERAEQEMHVVGQDGRIATGADAVLEILAEYPRWRWLSRLGRWPGVLQLLRLGYRFVAANRHFLAGQNARVFWVKVVLVLGMLAGILLSLPLWTGDRSYPPVPVAAWLPVLPVELGYFLLGGMLVTLGAGLVSSRPRPYIWSFLLIAGVLALLDQSRLQPWFYQYCLMLAALGLFSWRHTDAERRQAVLAACMLVVACLYIFSGLQKLHPNFMHGVFPWLVEPLTAGLPPGGRQAVQALGGFVPLMEVAVGLGLLVQRFRNLAVLAAVAMHLGILYFVGPWGHDWNTVIWPWNLVMIALVLLLFWRSPLGGRSVLWNGRFAYHGVLLVLVAVLPAVSLYGRWDSYLSASLYTGTVKSGTVHMDLAAAAALPASASRHVAYHQGGFSLDISGWSLGEMNVPAYPEGRVFKAVANRLCQHAPVGASLRLDIRDPRAARPADRLKSYSCFGLSG